MLPLLDLKNLFLGLESKMKLIEYPPGQVWYFESGPLNGQINKIGDTYSVEVWGGTMISPRLVYKAAGLASLEDVSREVSHMVVIHGEGR